MPDYKHVPDELRRLPQWVCWRTETRGNKPTKVPYDPATGSLASSTDAATWSAFEDAVAAQGYDGIGFVFSADDPFCGVDFDHCVTEDGPLLPHVTRWLTRLDSYTESSPSGTGYHVIVRATLPPGAKHKHSGLGVEVYDRARYFTVTGERLSRRPADVMERQDVVDAMLLELWPPKAEPPRKASTPGTPPDLSDQALLERMLRASNGAEIGRLIAGDTTDHGGDESAADLALCNHLAFWTGCDRGRMDSLFRSTGLYRDKWDAKRGDTTYGGMTIDRAVEDCRNVYSPEPPANGKTTWGKDTVNIVNGTATAEEDGQRDTVRRKEEPAARAWAEKAGDSYLYTSNEQWWEYRGGRWFQVDEPYIHRSIREFLLPIWGDNLKPVHIANVTKLASLQLLRDFKDMGGRMTLIPFRNGVLDMVTGEFLRHSPEFLLTRQLQYDYDPKADCPRFKAFLRQVLITDEGTTCEEWVRIMQQWFGYLLIPDASAQTAMVWVGAGANGKGVLTKVMEGFVGRDFTTAVAVDQLHDPYHRADLYGKMLGITGDLDRAAMRKSAGWFKAIVGGDEISARHPAGRVFRFTSAMRIVISCNDLPDTSDVSYGYFRRLLIIDFRLRLSDRDRVYDLPDQLLTELPGIFNWALAGLRSFENGHRRFCESLESRRVLNEYQYSMDPVAQFIADECETGPELTCLNDDLYRAFGEWCFRNGIKPTPNAQSFGQGLSRAGIAKASTVRDGDSTRKARRGIAIAKRESDEDAWTQKDL